MTPSGLGRKVTMTDNTQRAIHYLARSPLLQGVSEEILKLLDPPPETIFLKAGDTLIRKGEENSDYFVLVSGRLCAFDEEGGRLVPQLVIHPGEGVGEIALLTNEPGSATVMARLDSEVIRFPHASFLVLAAGHQGTLLQIARTAINRALGRSESKKKIGDFRSIAIVPLRLGIDTRPTANDLAQELRVYGRICLVDQESTLNLDELEENFDFVVYTAGPQANNWSRTCLLRADLVLLTATVPGSAEVGEVEDQLLRRLDRNIVGRIDLLFIHPSQWHRHSGVARWLERLSPSEHHHVRSGNRSDLARLARIIVGRANNLVLSGGGARAFAQIGALRALKEFSIPVDRVGGCSGGAAIGAIRALTEDFDDMILKLRKLFLKRRPARDVTIPFLSLLAGKKMTKIALDLFGDWRIEDLPTRYFCNSSDLGSGEIVEHFDGLVWLALRASASMPVAAPPLLRNNRVLVDGGVLDNFPIDIMRKHFSGRTLAIDVSKNEPLKVDPRWELMCPSGVEVLRAKLNPFGPSPGLPGILQVLFRTTTLASDRLSQQNREQAGFLLIPPVERFGLTDFDDFDEIVEIGYRYTISVLEKASETDSH